MIKLITHIKDIDGMGSAILANIVWKDDVSMLNSEAYEVDKNLKKVLDEDKEYEKIVEEIEEKKQKKEKIKINFPIEVFFDWDSYEFKSDYNFILEDVVAFLY